MKRTRKESKDPNPPEGFSFGRDIRVEQMHRRVAETPDGRAVAYFGLIKPGVQGDVRFVKLRELQVCDAEQRKSYRFVELKGGGLFQSSFLRDERHFRVRDDLFVRFPYIQNSTFGVFKEGTDELQEALTRQLFGATQEELEDFLRAYFGASHFPIEEQSQRHFCRTTSSTKANACDLSRLLIPPEFPYIAIFDSHISLHGFYQHLAFLCEHRSMRLDRPGGSFFKVLVEHGAKPELIRRLREAARTYGGSPLYYGEALE